MSIKINEKLLEIRKNHKLSRKGLSNLSGFKERTILSYERGENKPSDRYIRFISLYFNVSEDFIIGRQEMKLALSSAKRVILMYQDIYSYDDVGMMEIFHDKNFDFVELLKDFSYKRSPNILEIIEISEILNIKPSSFELKKFSEELRKFHLLFDAKEEHEKFLKRIQNQEEKGVLLNSDYYVEMIKKRNLAKDNYIPIDNPIKLEEKYQKVCDLLPYASDRFLEDIYNKLKALKELQTL